MRAGHIAGGARAHLDALDRFEAADIIVPFGDLLHQRVGDGHRQLRRPLGSRVARAGGDQQRKEERRHKEEALGHGVWRSEEHTSELQLLMRSSYAVFCLKKKRMRTRMTSSHSCESRIQVSARNYK